MNKKYIVGVLVICSTVLIMSSCGSCGYMKKLLDIQHRQDFNDIAILKEIIRSDKYNIVRERAIFIITEIAINNDKQSEVKPFLENLILSEPNMIILGAAYANLNLINDTVENEEYGDLELSIKGVLEVGNEIELECLCSSQLERTIAMLGIARIVPIDAISSDGIVNTSRNPIRFEMGGGETTKKSFILSLNSPGKFGIAVKLKINIDSDNYQLIEKQIVFYVTNDFNLPDPPQIPNPNNIGIVS